MKVTVIKRDSQGEETWRYQGQILSRDSNSITLEARFNHNDVDFHGMNLVRGDRFIEIYYTDRWYNIFEIYDQDNDDLKGWYCNIGHPAVIEDEIVSYRDLALDLLVLPDGSQIVLDEDEFDSLVLPQEDRTEAKGALGDLQAMFRKQFKASGRSE